MISVYPYKGLICSCGEKHIFKEDLSMWNNHIIKCTCKEKYLPYMNGTNYPVIFTNKEWVKYGGTIV